MIFVKNNFFSDLLIVIFSKEIFPLLVEVDFSEIFWPEHFFQLDS